MRCRVTLNQLIPKGGMAKSRFQVVKKISAQIILLLLVSAVGVVARAADAPLSVNDIRLLLIGGAAPAKAVALIEERGIDFKVTPELEKKFHDDGADDTVIQALRKALNKPVPAPAEASGIQAAKATTTPPAAPSVPSPPISPDKKIADTLNDLTKNTPSGPGPATIPAATPKVAKVDLKDPSPAEIQNIIREFAAKEKTFEEARNNYTYHQSNKVEEFGPDGEID